MIQPHRKYSQPQLLFTLQLVVCFHPTHRPVPFIEPMYFYVNRRDEVSPKGDGILCLEPVPNVSRDAMLVLTKPRPVLSTLSVTWARVLPTSSLPAAGAQQAFLPPEEGSDSYEGGTGDLEFSSEEGR